MSQQIIVSLEPAVARLSQLLEHERLEKESITSTVSFLAGALFVSKEGWDTDLTIETARDYLSNITELNSEQVIEVEREISKLIAQCIITVLPTFGGPTCVPKGYKAFNDNAIVIEL